MRPGLAIRSPRRFGGLRSFCGDHERRGGYRAPGAGRPGQGVDSRRPDSTEWLAVKKKKAPSGNAAETREHRRGNRAKAVIPIGVRVGGRPLTAGCTLNVGESGALLICSEDLEIGTEMQVTNLKTDEFFTCRVVRRAGFHESGRFGLGVEILKPDRETADALSAAEPHKKKRH
jgi:PilZ domain-containing protein